MTNPYFVKRDCCPVCQSRVFKTLYSCAFSELPIKEYLESFYAPQGGVEFEYLDGAEFILDECTDCGLIYQREIPNAFLMGKLYEEWIDPERALDIYRKKQTARYYFKFAQELLMIMSHFDTVPSQLKVLDYGMGWGYWCRMAEAFGCDTYGFEVSEARIAHTKSHSVKVVNWHEISDNSFDFINTEQVFEHLPQPLEILYYLRAALKPKGLIKVSVPNGSDIKRRLRICDWTAPKRSRNSLNAISPLEHINCFNHAAVIRMADLAGLQLMEIPLNVQYGSSMMNSAFSMLSNAPRTNWELIKRVIGAVLRPSHRSRFHQRGTYLLFRQKS